MLCDVSTAFDRVWHKCLIFKLRQNDIEGRLLEWLNSYLSQRKQDVDLKVSKGAKIRSGSIQSSTTPDPGYQ